MNYGDERWFVSIFFIPKVALTCGDVKQAEISKFAMHKTLQ